MIDKIKNDLKTAMKNGQKEKLNPLRNLVTKMKMKEIEKGDPLSDDECLKVCISAAKQIKESIIQFEKGGRPDLSESEKMYEYAANYLDKLELYSNNNSAPRILVIKNVTSEPYSIAYAIVCIGGKL